MQQRYIDKYNFQYRDDDIAKKKIIIIYSESFIQSFDPFNYNFKF